MTESFDVSSNAVPAVTVGEWQANDVGTGADLPIFRTHAGPARLFWRARCHLLSTNVASP